jgi:hypothetical protein
LVLLERTKSSLAFTKAIAFVQQFLRISRFKTTFGELIVFAFVLLTDFGGERRLCVLPKQKNITGAPCLTDSVCVTRL